MSLRNLTLVLLLVLPVCLSKAQSTTATPVEPTAIGVIYDLVPETQELKQLPDEQWKEEGAFYAVVSGSQSSFRIKASNNIAFTFKTGSPEKVSLYSFEQKKNKRRFLFEKIRGAMIIVPVKGLPVELTQFGASSYKLVPASPLTPGEYAITIADEVYTFGVD
jgi:hypothetical protein